MSSKTLVAVRRSLERDHDVLPPVRRPYAVSTFHWSATSGETRSTIRKCQHSESVTFSNLPPLRRRSSGLMAADRVSTGRDRTTNCTVDYGLCPLFGRARSVEERRPSDSLQPSPYFIIGPRTWADEWGTPDLLGSPCHRPAQHVLVFPSSDNWTTNHLIP